MDFLKQPKQDFDPGSLPPIDALEIVLLDKDPLQPTLDFMQKAAENRRVRVSGPQAQAMANLWRQLPGAMQMRCHLPRFGLRFFAGEQCLLEGSVCWRCNNVYGRLSSGTFHFQFDGESAPAVVLLELVREYAPDGGK